MKVFGERGLIWVSLWAGGAVWFLHLAAAWLFAEFGCIGGLARLGPMGLTWVAWGILAVSFLAVALSGAAIYLSLLCGRSCPGTEGQFAYRYGVVANPLFLLFIIAQTVPVFFHLNQCVGPILG